MPAYNAEKYIGEAIDSVLAQTFMDFELLIINDGSTDSTSKIIDSYDDPRIRLINQSNQGIAAALNIGLLNAKADLIARFDADDICMPERLMLQYRFLLNHPDHIIVGSDADHVDMNGNFVYDRRMPAHTNEEIQSLGIETPAFIHSAVLYRKAPIMGLGGYNANAYAFQDLVLWSKVLKQGKGHNLYEKLIQVRLSPGSISIDNRWHTKRFSEIMFGAIRTGELSEQEGKEVRAILQEQNIPKIKEGSYYSLLGKKYLWDNYQPRKARVNLKKAIRIHPGRFDNYAIMVLSFFPKGFINWLYKQKLQNT
jgi:glycosyltransferase involved in cell wall biosynthesis